MTSNYDHFVEEANLAATQGKWDVAFENLSQAHKLKPDDAGVLTGIARCAMELGMKKEALTFFQQVIILAPDSTDAHNNLGIIQTNLGLWDEAEGSYQMAITMDPDNAEAWKNLALLYLRSGDRAKEGVEILDAVRQSNPLDVDAWYLLGECYDEIGDFASAKALYEHVLTIDPNYLFAKQMLEELNKAGRPAQSAASPLPPIDRIARPEHAKKLASLRDLIKKPDVPSSSGGSRPARSLAFYGPAEIFAEARLSPPARAFSKVGRQVKLSTKLDKDDLEKADFFLFMNPHYSRELLDSVKTALHAARLRPGVRVAIDLDRDFYAIPIDQPEFMHVGAGNPPLLKELEGILEMVDAVTLPCPALGTVYGKFAKKLEIIPPTWSKADVLWEKTAPKRKTVNLGVVGIHTRVADVTVMKAGLQRILEEFPETMLAVGGDMALYDAFDGIPEARKTYIPIGQVKDYPYLLANFDVLLVPLEDIPFNHSRSDVALLEAGIRRIPWIATTIPAFQEWKDGGILADNEADWESALRRLLKESTQRTELGGAGRTKAELREADASLHFWDEILKD